MAVYQRKSGIYAVQFMFNGKNYIRSSGLRNKQKALQLEAKMRSELFDKEVMEKQVEISLPDAIDLYIEKNLNSSRYRAMSSIAKWYEPHTKNMMLHDISTSWLHKVIQIKEREGVAKGTLKIYAQFINGVAKNAGNFGYRTESYTLPKTKQSKPRLRFLSPDEETRLLDALNPLSENNRTQLYQVRQPQHLTALQTDFDLCVLLLDTGARLGEIQKLKWGQIDLKNRTISLWRPKVQNQSILFMTDRIFDVLTRRETEATSEFIFTDSAGDFHKCTHGLRNTIKRIGLNDCTIHTLRHTAASRLVQNGLNIYEVKEILGHTNISTTMRYAHLDHRKSHVKPATFLMVCKSPRPSNQ